MELRLPYRILTEDPIPIRDLPGRDGAVEILGRAVPDGGKHVEAPFSGTECLAYEYEVQERQSSGQNST